MLVTSVWSTCVRGCLLCWAKRYQRHGDRWSDAVTSGFIYIGRGLCRILVGMLAAVQTWAFPQALPANNTPSVRTCRNRLSICYMTVTVHSVMRELGNGMLEGQRKPFRWYSGNPPQSNAGVKLLYSLISTILVCLNLYVRGRNLPAPYIMERIYCCALSATNCRPVYSRASASAWCELPHIS